jgi:hypothetical protein
MLADRIGALEGSVEDLRDGRVPNIAAELGWKAEWRYNRINLVSRLFLRAAVMGVADKLLATPADPIACPPGRS